MVKKTAAKASKTAEIRAFFDESAVPPLGGSTTFSLQKWELWEATKARGITPRYLRASDASVAQLAQTRGEFLAAAERFGFDLVDLDDTARIAEMKAMRPRRLPLQPQQLLVSDTLAAEDPDAVIEMPRRASKTTSIFIVVFGRMLNRPGYEATFSAQTGVKGTARLREWKTKLDIYNPDPLAHLPPWARNTRPAAPARVDKARARQTALFGEYLYPDPEPDDATDGPSARGYRIMMGEVGKGIYFDNGAKMLVLKPESEAYRGEAGDFCWIDEAQEIDPDTGDDLLAGLLPLRDTKDSSTILLSGTAGEAQVGPFWKWIDKLRNATAADKIAGFDYAADPDTPWSDIENEDTAMTLVEAVHPGVGTLTTMEKMLTNYRAMSAPAWAREYVSLWPKTAGSRAIPEDKWNAAAAPFAKRPGRVGFAYDIQPGGGVAAIAAAWRDRRGVAYIELVDHRHGTDWLPGRIQELNRKHRLGLMGFDDISESKATHLETQRLRPRPRMKALQYREIAAGCVQILRDLRRGKLVQFDQVAMNNAAADTTIRTSGTSGIWLFSSAPGGDATPMLAAVKALQIYDRYQADKAGRGTESADDLMGS